MSIASARLPGVGVSHEYAVSVLTDRERLHAMRGEWADLLPASRHHSVFLTWEWMTVWMHEYHSRGRPYIVLVRRVRDGLLAGLAPLYETVTPRPFALRLLALMGTGAGADHLAFVFRRDMETHARAALAEFLISVQWDALDCPHLDEDTARWLLESVAGSGRGKFAHSAGVADVCPFVPLPGTWEEYLRTLSSNARKDLGRRWRRLQEHGDVAIQRVQALDELDRAWDVFFRLHQERRQAVDGRSAFAAGRVGAFHKAFMRSAAERGWLRLYLMRVGEQYVAAEYCLHVGSRVSDFQTGFDMRWSRYGVGTLLVAHAIKEAIAEGAREFDLLRGGEEYKQQRWGASLRRDMSLLIWRRRPRVAMHIATRRWTSIVKSHLRQRLTAVRRTRVPRDNEDGER